MALMNFLGQFGAPSKAGNGAGASQSGAKNNDATSAMDADAGNAPDGETPPPFAAMMHGTDSSTGKAALRFSFMRAEGAVESASATLVQGQETPSLLEGVPVTQRALVAPQIGPVAVEGEAVVESGASGHLSTFDSLGKQIGVPSTGPVVAGGSLNATAQSSGGSTLPNVSSVSQPELGSRAAVGLALSSAVAGGEATASPSEAARGSDVRVPGTSKEAVLMASSVVPRAGQASARLASAAGQVVTGDVAEERPNAGSQTAGAASTPPLAQARVVVAQAGANPVASNAQKSSEDGVLRATSIAQTVTGDAETARAPLSSAPTSATQPPTHPSPTQTIFEAAQPANQTVSQVLMADMPEPVAVEVLPTTEAQTKADEISSARQASETGQQMRKQLGAMVRQADLSAGNTRLVLSSGAMGRLEVEIVSTNDAISRVVVRPENPALFNNLAEARDQLQRILGLDDPTQLDLRDPGQRDQQASQWSERGAAESETASLQDATENPEPVSDRPPRLMGRNAVGLDLMT